MTKAYKLIRMQNILVKDHQIYVTDFGISRDWSDLGHSTTTGFTSATLKYSAPEVAAFLPRNSSADMWSLGCVFLEIWTVLKGETVQALTEYLGTTGSKSSLYHSNITGVRSWCNMLLEKPGDTELKRPEAWISNMLEMEPHSRYIAHTLLELIQESCQGPDARYPFIGLCCTDYDDSAESVQSSVFEPNLVEYTTTDTTESTDLSKEVAGISEEGTRAECAEDKTLLPTQMTKSIVAANSVVKTGSDTHIKADSSTQRLGGQGSVISTLPVNTDMESGSTSAVVLSEDLAKGMINLERGVGDLQVKSWSGERVDGSSSSCSKSQGDNPLHNGKEIAPSTMQVSSSHTTVMPAGQAAIDKPDEETNHGPPTLGLITPEERKLYNEIFFSTISPGGCMLAGDQARAIFDQSGLPTDELAKIWLLSDPNCRGSLNPAEFSVAMHLINCKVNNIAIPDRLPHTLVVKLYGSIPLRSTAPVPRPAESTVRESREAAPLTRYANRQPTFKTETPYPTSDTDADTDVSMALELQKEREKQKREMQKKFEQQTHGQNILGPDGLLALDRSQLSTEVGPTTPIQIFITIWDAHGIAQPQDDLYSLSYRDLHESVFLDKLRSRIGVTRLQVVNFERYSVSAGGWVTLDSNNQEAWKMMHRAAETSLQLRIRATVFPE